MTLAADARVRDIDFAQGEAAQVAGIWRRGWAAGHPDVVTVEPIAHWLARVQTEFKAPNEAVVIERRDQVLAFMVMHCARGYVAQLFVEPHLRAQGFGRELLAEASVRMPNGWRLHVATANLQAQRFYDHLGLARGSIDRHPTTGRERVAYHWHPASS
ncbi:MAG: N-acetyltransferase [Variovorax sp.]|nr:MAG: N-acetyltransferase [Variovorax sp.]